MVGKIMIVKSLIIPNITYVASVTNKDKEYVSKFKNPPKKNYSLILYTSAIINSPLHYKTPP
jgi:hypothetical protein